MTPVFSRRYVRGNRSRMVNPPSILDDLVDPDSLDEMEDVTGMKSVPCFWNLLLLPYENCVEVFLVSLLHLAVFGPFLRSKVSCYFFLFSTLSHLQQ